MEDLFTEEKKARAFFERENKCGEFSAHISNELLICWLKVIAKKRNVNVKVVLEDALSRSLPTMVREEISIEDYWKVLGLPEPKED